MRIYEFLHLVPSKEKKAVALFWGNKEVLPKGRRPSVDILTTLEGEKILEEVAEMLALLLGMYFIPNGNKEALTLCKHDSYEPVLEKEICFSFHSEKHSTSFSYLYDGKGAIRRGHFDGYFWQPFMADLDLFHEVASFLAQALGRELVSFQERHIKHLVPK